MILATGFGASGVDSAFFRDDFFFLLFFVFGGIIGESESDGLGGEALNRDFEGGIMLDETCASADDSKTSASGSDSLGIEDGIGSDRKLGLLDLDDLPDLELAVLALEDLPAGGDTKTLLHTGHSTGLPRFLSGIPSFPSHFGQFSYRNVFSVVPFSNSLTTEPANASA